MYQELTQDIVRMYQDGRSNVFIEAFQQETADLPQYATVEKVGNVKLHKVPVSGTREMGYRQERHEDIIATEDMYAWRTMRPIMMDDWDSISRDDPHFLDNLPINLTRIARMQGYAAARATDGILSGVCVNGDKSSPLYGEMIVRTAQTVHEDAVTGSVYKGGTTSGIFGTAYTGEYGDEAVDLVYQPTVLGSDSPLESYTDYNESCVLNLRTTGVIAVNYVSSGTPVVSGMTPAKLRAAIAAMRARKAKGQLVLMITHMDALALMEHEEMKNMLYGHQAGKNGLPDSILGVKLLISDYVPLVPIGGGVWARACPLYHKDDLVYGIWENARFEIRQPQHKKDSIYAGCSLTMGATRRREEAFVLIMCDAGVKVSV